MIRAHGHGLSCNGPGARAMNRLPILAALAGGCSIGGFFPLPGDLAGGSDLAPARPADGGDAPDHAAPGDSASRADLGPGRRLAFATSRLYPPNFGGLAVADAHCQELAQAAGLPGSYMAWLSDGLGASPSNRFLKSALPYARVDG